MTHRPGNSTSDPDAGLFQPTRWSLIIAAAYQNPEALHEFCQGYRYPVYAHLRRQGLSPEDAEDRTQEVFSRLTQPDALKGLSAERGRFRTYILACAENEANRWRASQAAKKRGGGTVPLSLDQSEAESRFAQEASSTTDPITAYDQAFALVVLGRVMESMQREYRRTKQTDLFAMLCPLLTDPPEHGELAAIAKRLGMTEGALRVSWHRLRQRFAVLLLEEVSRTVNDPKDARSELLHLLSALATAPVGPPQSGGPQ